MIPFTKAGHINLRSTIDPIYLAFNRQKGPHQAQIWSPTHTKSPFCLGSQPQYVEADKIWEGLFGAWQSPILMLTLTTHTRVLTKEDLKCPKDLRSKWIDADLEDWYRTKHNGIAMGQTDLIKSSVQVIDPTRMKMDINPKEEDLKQIFIKTLEGKSVCWRI